jgi:predicted amidohydrolase
MMDQENAKRIYLAAEKAAEGMCKLLGFPSYFFAREEAKKAAETEAERLGEEITPDEIKKIAEEVANDVHHFYRL